MRTISKVLVGVSVMGVGVAIMRGVLARRGASAAVAGSAAGTGHAAGSMSVGAIDELAISARFGSASSGAGPEGFDPEEVPSAHSEVNELRNKMPFG
jgi:hypothetical protein